MPEGSASLVLTMLAMAGTTVGSVLVAVWAVVKFYLEDRLKEQSAGQERIWRSQQSLLERDHRDGHAVAAHFGSASATFVNVQAATLDIRIEAFRELWDVLSAVRDQCRPAIERQRWIKPGGEQTFPGLKAEPEPIFSDDEAARLHGRANRARPFVSLDVWQAYAAYVETAVHCHYLRLHDGLVDHWSKDPRIAAVVEEVLATDPVPERDLANQNDRQRSATSLFRTLHVLEARMLAAGRRTLLLVDGVDEAREAASAFTGDYRSVMRPSFEPTGEGQSRDVMPSGVQVGQPAEGGPAGGSGDAR